jgi:hypothetical protein
MVLCLDDVPPTTLVDEINGVEGMLDTWLVRLGASR